MTTLDGPALLGADLQALSRGQTIALAKVDIEGSETSLDFWELYT